MGSPTSNRNSLFQPLSTLYWDGDVYQLFHVAKKQIKCVTTVR